MRDTMTLTHYSSVLRQNSGEAVAMQTDYKTHLVPTLVKCTYFIIMDKLPVSD